jgi:hypothetical protein
VIHGYTTPPSVPVRRHFWESPVRFFFGVEDFPMPAGKWLLVAGIVAITLILEAAIFVFVMPRGAHESQVSAAPTHPKD